jgi:hypothetical protein
LKGFLSPLNSIWGLVSEDRRFEIKIDGTKRSKKMSSSKKLYQARCHEVIENM